MPPSGGRLLDPLRERYLAPGQRSPEKNAAREDCHFGIGERSQATREVREVLRNVATARASAPGLGRVARSDGHLFQAPAGEAREGLREARHVSVELPEVAGQALRVALARPEPQRALGFVQRHEIDLGVARVPVTLDALAEREVAETRARAFFVQDANEALEPVAFSFESGIGTYTNLVPLELQRLLHQARLPDPPPSRDLLEEEAPPVRPGPGGLPVRFARCDHLA